MGNFRDDTVMKRFFLSLKMERVWKRDHAKATIQVADHIVSLHNNVRLHWKSGNLSPHAVERQSALELPIGVCDIT